MNSLKPLAATCLSVSLGVAAFAELEEIIVTATKREANVQDLPIAITAVSGGQLQRAGVNDIRDLAKVSTSFKATTTNSETRGTTLRIRGIGTSANNTEFESAVGVFLDGVYLSRPGVALADLVDVERIEVLRGPQGTLFGRNTSAGALSIVTKKPDFDGNSFWANAGFGNYDARNVQMGANVPLIDDTLAVRVSGSSRQRDGLYDSVSDGSESNNRDRYSLRGQLLWNINEAADLRIIADYSDTDEQCCSPVIISDGPLSGLFGRFGLDNGAGVTALGKDVIEKDKYNAAEGTAKAEQFGLSAELNWDLGFADLTSIVSYRDFEAETSGDLDFVGADVFSIPNNNPAPTEIETWTAELRLQGSNGRLDWMVGAYYSDETIEEIQNVVAGEDFGAYISPSIFGALGQILGGVPAPAAAIVTSGAARLANGTPIAAILNPANPVNPALVLSGGVPFTGGTATNRGGHDAQSWSVYSHNTFEISDQLDLVFGLRWINESKEGGNEQLAFDNPGCASVLANTSTIANSFQGPLAAVGQQIAGGFASIACFFPTAPAALLGSPFERNYDDDELTYTLKLVYDLNDQSTAYISASHGFKAGGINLGAESARGGASAVFEPELIDSYEIGYKADLHDSRVRANVAVFYQELEDFQQLQFDGLRFTTYNLPLVVSRGIETEFVFSLLPNLDVNASVTYTDAHYSKSCSDEVFDNAAIAALCGERLGSAPEFAATVSGIYYQSIANTGLNLFVNASAQYESKRAAGATDDGIVPDQGGATKFDLRLGISNENKDWTVEFWGSNLSDKRTRTSAIAVPLRGSGAYGGFYDAPRTYGLTLRTEF